MEARTKPVQITIAPSDGQGEMPTPAGPSLDGPAVTHFRRRIFLMRAAAPASDSTKRVAATTRPESGRSRMPGTLSMRKAMTDAVTTSDSASAASHTLQMLTPNSFPLAYFPMMPPRLTQPAYQVNAPTIRTS